VDWGPTFAAVSMTVLPTLLLFLVLNQRVMKGLTSGSVKG
jgi:raffinose/stachyose/melibiose transport system permease protein